jgi:hypothetical protein
MTKPGYVVPRWHLRHHLSLLLACTGLFLALANHSPAQGVVSVTDTTEWNPWVRPDGSIMTDPRADQQTGQAHSDFVGDTQVYGFLQKWGELNGVESLLFRARMDAFRTQSFNNSISLGFDLNNDGALNLFMRMDVTNQGAATLSFATPGNNLNTSPSTTSWGNWQGTINLVTSGPTATYNYQSIPEVFGTNGNDAYITWAISFQNLSNAIRTYAPGFGNFDDITPDTRLSFIAFTHNQQNALNQDLYGVTGGTTSTLTWAQLGASTAFVTPDGIIPEPAGFVQVSVLLSVSMWAVYGRRRPRTTIVG